MHTPPAGRCIHHYMHNAHVPEEDATNTNRRRCTLTHALCRTDTVSTHNVHVAILGADISPEQQCAVCKHIHMCM